MSYQVLARKWRPREFEQLVGQESTVRTLSNALKNGRLHHAYLFTGTRGVGKTTLARILAKAFNCEQGVTATPCGQCANCKAVDNGNFIDLIEIDAASRTKVEDTRELLNNVQFLPSRGAYKIYLIDEVHMLSGHSFNALLKTLEEPPEHTKFFLATTDPQKLPITILSRCLKFNLKKIAPDKIAKHLDSLLEKEGIEGEKPATRLLAHAATGSLRDALSLLDQAIAHGDGSVHEKQVRAMLGISDKGVIPLLVRHLISKDTASALQLVQTLDEVGSDFHQILEELLSFLHALAIEQAAPGVFSEQQDEDKKAVAELSQKISPEDAQLYYQFALKGQADLDFAPNAKAGMEMVLLRMLLFSENTEANPKKKTFSPSAKSTQNLAQETPPKESGPALSPVVSQTKNVDEKSWPDLVHQLRLTRLTKQLAHHCSLKTFQDNMITLELPKKQAPLFTEDQRQKLQKALTDALHQSITLAINFSETTTLTPAELTKKKQSEALKQAQKSFENNPNIVALKKKFNATTLTESIKPMN